MNAPDCGRPLSSLEEFQLGKIEANLRDPGPPTDGWDKAPRAVPPEIDPLLQNLGGHIPKGHVALTRIVDTGPVLE